MVTFTNRVIAGPDLLRTRPLALSRFSQQPNIGEDQKKSYNFSSGPLAGTQARSQKFAMGGCLGGRGLAPQSPEANGGLWAKPPAAGGWGSGEKAPSRRRHGCLRAESPALALENF